MKFTADINVKCSMLDVKFLILTSIIILFSSISIFAQLNVKEAEKKDPRGALLRSLVVPGWGHYYVNKNNWNRGKYHLGADVILIASYFGINTRANSLQDDLRILARSNAQTELDGMSRDFELAVSNFNSQAEYNDFQRRTRNVDQLFEGSEFFWEWDSEADRVDFQDVRSRVDRNENQLPVLASLLVLNRVVSGISAFIQARKTNDAIPELSFSYIRPDGNRGVTANLVFSF